MMNLEADKASLTRKHGSKDDPDDYFVNNLNDDFRDGSQQGPKYD